jgi:hypothetical protein
MARAVGWLVAEHLTHLPYAHEQVAALPRAVFDQARSLFEPEDAAGETPLS